MIKDEGRGYFRLHIDVKADIPSNFNQEVYDLLATTGDEVRFNPKTIWEGRTAEKQGTGEEPVFEVAELQQMTNPVDFIERTIDQYEGLKMDEVRRLFEQVEAEVRMMEAKPEGKGKKKADK